MASRSPSARQEWRVRDAEALDHSSSEIPRKQRLSAFLARAAGVEFLLVAAIAYSASLFYNRAISPVWMPERHHYVGAALFISTMVLVISLAFRHFAEFQTRPLHIVLCRGVAAVIFAFSFLLSMIFLLKLTEQYSRVTFVFQFVSVTIVVVGVRAVSCSLLHSAVAKGVVEARRVVLIGDAGLASLYEPRLRASGFRTIGILPLHQRGSAGERSTRNLNCRRLIEACRRLSPDEILVLGTQENWPSTVTAVQALSDLPTAVHLVLVDMVALFATSRIVDFGNVVAMQISRPPLSELDRALKRALDLILSLGGLILLLPLFLSLALAIKLDSPGPVFFRQTRHGYNNRGIRVWKFRSLTVMEDGNDFRQVARDDARVTRIGHILRRSNMDELPQLFNVLSGEMSIVGPRPHATAHNALFEDKIPPFSRRHNVKPGITGWAQVNGYRGATDTLEKMQKRVEYDLFYIDNWSFLFDLKIIAMTVFSKNAYMNAY
jgi:Undecaprenyl-phosphate glucose phosphotransferase